MQFRVARFARTAGRTGGNGPARERLSPLRRTADALGRFDCVACALGLGVVVFHAAGALIHLLLVVAAIMLIYRVMTRRGGA